MTLGPRCSIVIRCFNEERHIGKLLSGIGQQTESNYEIILVDSGSTDATLSIASHYPVKILSIPPEEFSFGRSLNLGCAAATGEFVVIVSAHVYPMYEDWLELLLEGFADSDVALCYGRQRGDEQTRYSEHQVFAQWFRAESRTRQIDPFCNNANAAVRRSLWLQRPYNEDLTGLEDLDWALSMVNQGRVLSYAASAEVFHAHEESPARIYNRYRREALAHKLIFPDQTFTLLDFSRLFPASVVSDYLRAIRDRMLLSNLVGIAMFRLMQYWGTYRGFRSRSQVADDLKRRFFYPRSPIRKAPPAAGLARRRKIDYSRLDSRRANQSPDSVHSAVADVRSDD